MTPEEQRIAITEACPGCRCMSEDGVFWIFVTKDGRAYEDPLNDLNAMHTARSIIAGNTALRVEYLNQLRRVIGGLVSDFDLLHATAAQHGEAFLKTIGKWKETK